MNVNRPMDCIDHIRQAATNARIFFQFLFWH